MLLAPHLLLIHFLLKLQFLRNPRKKCIFLIIEKSCNSEGCTGRSGPILLIFETNLSLGKILRRIGFGLKRTHHTADSKDTETDFSHKKGEEGV